MRTCSRCGNERADSEFYTANGVINTTRCRKCFRASENTPEVRAVRAQAKKVREQTPGFLKDRNAKARAYYHANREKIKAKYIYKAEEARAYRLGWSFGITVEEYERLNTDQGGVCEVCQKPESTKTSTGKSVRLSVDHDHSTGKVRALLCRECNTSLGLLGEDSRRILRLYEYIAHHKPEAECPLL